MEQERPPQEADSTHAETLAPTPEKKCLNCGTVLHGKYCVHCGQKDTKLREPLFHLIGEFIGDFFHFDSKFFRTFKPLLFRPGVLTMEYCNGRRARYVHPIRLYFFVSVIFFLFYFSLAPKKFITEDSIRTSGSDSAAMETLNRAEDSLARMIGNKNVRIIIKEPVETGIDSSVANAFGPASSLPETIAEYEDSIRKLPKDSVPGFFQQVVDRRAIEAKEKGLQTVLKEIAELANHELPKIMFLLLPLYALLLKLLYIRHRIYFVDHAVFSLHVHAFAFIVFLLALLISLIFNVGFSGWYILLLLVYLFVALRKVYKQSYGKTFLKTLLLLVLYSTSFAISIILLVVYAAIAA